MQIYKRTIRALKSIDRNIDEMSDKQLLAWDKVVTNITIRKRLEKVFEHAEYVNRICKIVITDDLDNMQYTIFEIYYKPYAYYIIRDKNLEIVDVRRIKNKFEC